MKLYYTDIRNPLTTFLAKEAEQLALEGKRVFYIAPNSLSFEKERAVLENLPQKASFRITITRFAQMARYFVLNDVVTEKDLDDIGLGMIFYRTLSQLKDQDLQVYGSLKQDSQFIQQLVELYHELQKAQMSFTDLEFIKEPKKRQDLLTIFEAVTIQLNEGQFDSSSKIEAFQKQILAGNLDEDLSQLALVIDGFTRFSAEEASLIGLLHRKGAEIVIATYASERAYRSSFREGNLYQASVDFLLELAQEFQVKPRFVSSEANDAFSRISKVLEARYSFTESATVVTDEDKEKVEIWSCNSQKEEIEYVAKAIRQLLQAGVRYKDIRLLLGEVDAYQLQLRTIFDQYQIPFYLGRSESMSQHPLVQFMESLVRIKRYNFRREDILNLLKTGLYGAFSQKELDDFELYLQFADINGKDQFAAPFTKNQKQKFQLGVLNQLRQGVITPLLELFKARSQSTLGMLGKFTSFLEQIQLTTNLHRLLKGQDVQKEEEYEQVFKAFSHVLEQFAQVFKGQEVSLLDLLSLLQAGMLLSNYRMVPATVDVVTVQDYSLIEPLTAPYVFAIGLSQQHFPKLSQASGLLTDEDKENLNEKTGSKAGFLIAIKENLKKNRYVFLSLLNAATKKLVLAAPSLLNEAESQLSSYLLELTKEPLNFPIIQKMQQASSDDIGTYHGLLSRVIQLHQEEIGQDWNKEEETFWHVAVRVLRKHLKAKGIVIPAILSQVMTTPLKEETLLALYPEKEFQLSASGLNEFYKNQYGYFLKYVLHLQEEWSIRPDARSHGNFLHRIFERVLQDQSDLDFDQRLQKAIAATSEEREFSLLYDESGESRFLKELLLETAQSLSFLLAYNPLIETIREEENFQGENFAPLRGGKSLLVKGKVDRIDRLKTSGSLGVVDYKSSSTKFSYEEFFNGLNSQLPTYLAAVEHMQEAKKEGVFGAMYLQMTTPLVSFKDTHSVEDIVKEAKKSVRYTGLFLKDQAQSLNQFYEKGKRNLLTNEDLKVLLAYNAFLYQKAAESILSGKFAINPYTKDGRSIAPFVEQYKAITGFEANLHLGQARHLQGLDEKISPLSEDYRLAFIDKMRKELEK